MNIPIVQAYGMEYSWGYKWGYKWDIHDKWVIAHLYPHLISFHDSYPLRCHTNISRICCIQLQTYQSYQNVALQHIIQIEFRIHIHLLVKYPINPSISHHSYPQKNISLSIYISGIFLATPLRFMFFTPLSSIVYQIYIYIYIVRISMVIIYISL